MEFLRTGIIASRKFNTYIRGNEAIAIICVGFIFPLLLLWFSFYPAFRAYRQKRKESKEKSNQNMEFP
jgi:hypothetical protein